MYIFYLMRSRSVTGPTGAGKSTFIGRAVGRPEIGVGHDLESCTSEIRAVRYPHSDGERNIVLVDTPGFDDTFVTDTQILRNIANWLHYTYKQNVKLSGLLYLHRISDNRVAGTPLRNLNMFKELCGEDSFKNVILVTTMWDEILEDVGLQREEELQNTFWQRMIKLGSSAQRFDGTEESAWKIINSISVSPSRERSGLQIQREMVDQHRPVHRTSAGKVVLDSFSGLFTGFKGFFKRIGQRPNGRKYNLSDPGSFPFQMPSSSYSMASTATLSDSSTGGSDWTTNTEFSSSGACIEHGYRDALSVAITDLKLALSVADFVHIPCLKDIIIPSIKIASSVESMERAHHGLYQIVENAALLINVITEHAQRGRLSPDTKAVISTLSKALLCIENLVQHLAQQNSQAQEVLQHDDARAISSCANSMRMACDSLRSKLPAENRQTLFRIEVGLATVMQGLEERCHCGIPREALRHLSV
ncbi:P-loop containing nucleoside triphosphate hydrolase protein [Scleroderma yunnanense]